jgi:hypothetical protein
MKSDEIGVLTYVYLSANIFFLIKNRPFGLPFLLRNGDPSGRYFLTYIFFWIKISVAFEYDYLYIMEQ